MKYVLTLGDEVMLNSAVEAESLDSAQELMAQACLWISWAGLKARGSKAGMLEWDHPLVVAARVKRGL